MWFWEGTHKRPVNVLLSSPLRIVLVITRPRLQLAIHRGSRKKIRPATPTDVEEVVLLDDSGTIHLSWLSSLSERMILTGQLVFGTLQDRRTLPDGMSLAGRTTGR